MEVTNTYKHIYKYIQIYTNIYKYIQIYTNVYKYIQIYTNIYKYIQVWKYVFMNYPETQKHIIYMKISFLRIFFLWKRASNKCLFSNTKNSFWSEYIHVHVYFSGRDKTPIWFMYITNAVQLLMVCCQIIILSSQGDISYKLSLKYFMNSFYRWNGYFLHPPTLNLL